MASDKYTLDMTINDAQLEELNIDKDYFKNELHSLLISYGNTINRYASYEFDNGVLILFCITVLIKMYPAFQSIMHKLTITNKKGETLNLLNFLS